MDSKLKEQRIQSGFTQEEVAGSVDISTRQYQRYENEGFKPSIDKALSISKLFGVSLETLFPPHANVACDPPRPQATLTTQIRKGA
jgi:DNA-binding XRE family transcriptional regulator